ncbi:MULTISPECIES: hypothetical protein [Halorussus]|uniref:hypothetical protein n=1 Tax=Halorussus TaxID=1070314 RepID=UPI00209F98B8|nr:hypothetical protein [Halorussus vallis]USZ76193.1 hypothetical protein NGM07_02440 [Halorussus vallis]
MTKEAALSWLLEHGSVPTAVLKPVATKLGISTNYLGAALFAGQVVYENQETIVTYANKGGITVGQFLYERSRERYGEDHPLTRHLKGDVDAITEAFEGTEEEARTFAAFYRRYRAVDRRHRLTDEVDLDAFESLAENVSDVRGTMPGLWETTSGLRETTSGLRGATSDLRETVPDLRETTSDLRGTMPDVRETVPGIRRDARDTDSEESVDIPVTEPE